MALPKRMFWAITIWSRRCPRAVLCAVSSCRSNCTWRGLCLGSPQHLVLVMEARRMLTCRQTLQMYNDAGEGKGQGNLSIWWSTAGPDGASIHDKVCCRSFFKASGKVTSFTAARTRRINSCRPGPPRRLTLHGILAICAMDTALAEHFLQNGWITVNRLTFSLKGGNFKKMTSWSPCLPAFKSSSLWATPALILANVALAELLGVGRKNGFSWQLGVAVEHVPFEVDRKCRNQ